MKQWKAFAMLIPALILLGAPALGQVGEEEPTGLTDEEAACGLAACGGIFLFIMLAVLVINILILIWVAKDATARGMDNVPLWVILVFFTGLIGLIVYLVVRPKERVR